MKYLIFFRKHHSFLNFFFFLYLTLISGPPFGGFMYEFFGKTAPFLILACLALGNALFIFRRTHLVLKFGLVALVHTAVILKFKRKTTCLHNSCLQWSKILLNKKYILADGCLQLLVLQPGVNKMEEEEAPSLKVSFGSLEN